jgi:tRNA1Val (adenine37-N6)-methyltransferase
MSVFRFQQFSVKHADSAMKVGTDALVLGSLISFPNASSGLDIGTGSGVIALMVAQEHPNLYIDAIELDLAAANEASFNFKASPFSNRLTCLCHDFIDFQPEKKYDLIFSNPPFFEGSFKSSNQQRNAARHDDGLPLPILFQHVSNLLAEMGLFWIILPAATFDTYLLKASQVGLNCMTEISIYGKPNQLTRKIGCFVKQSNHLAQRTQKTIVIRDENGKYTTDYRQLTQYFHFNEI